MASGRPRRRPLPARRGARAGERRAAELGGGALFVGCRRVGLMGERSTGEALRLT